SCPCPTPLSCASVDCPARLHVSPLPSGRTGARGAAGVELFPARFHAVWPGATASGLRLGTRRLRCAAGGSLHRRSRPGGVRRILLIAATLKTKIACDLIVAFFTPPPPP